ncbi:hypothetical protein RP20_CCG027074 [Aedes albopictus]|nr:hypothetical protein RP20_CCG027074 [Aedes albopictus]
MTRFCQVPDFISPICYQGLTKSGYILHVDVEDHCRKFNSLGETTEHVVAGCSVLAGSPHRSQETRKFYQKLNASRNGFVPRAEICRDKDGGLLTDGRGVIERWKQYFDQHLNGVENVGTGAHVNGRNDDASAAEDGNEPTPTLREVKDAIHQLKTNKAADKDGIAAEPIKMGPDKLAICLHRLIVRI